LPESLRSVMLVLRNRLYVNFHPEVRRGTAELRLY
jgi:hypothetical protein